jgi:phosphoglycolate phosphatase
MSVLVFDLDGTLVSSADDLVATTNAVLTASGFSPAPDDQLRPMAGHGAKALLKCGLEENGIAWSEDMIAPMFRQFLEHYEVHMADTTRPFPGAVVALERLRSAGWLTAVCTNKSERLTHGLLERLDIARLFDAVVGGDTYPVSKPDAQPVLGAIANAGGTTDGALMIGDTATDINAARAARIPVVAVDFGYTPVPVRELGPDLVISHFDELEMAIRTLRPAA